MLKLNSSIFFMHCVQYTYTWQCTELHLTVQDEGAKELCWPGEGGRGGQHDHRTRPRVRHGAPGRDKQTDQMI